MLHLLWLPRFSLGYENKPHTDDIRLRVLIISDLGTLSGILAGTTKQGGFGSITANTCGVAAGS